MFDQKTIEALATLRMHAKQEARFMDGLTVDDRQSVGKLIDTLDNAGVFAAVDEQTGYASAVDILAESAKDDVAKDPGVYHGPRTQVPDKPEHDWL